ncbi:MAG: PqiC family protein [Deltaproteobacteria bacterium]
MANINLPIPLSSLLLMPVLLLLSSCARSPVINYYQLVSPEAGAPQKGSSIAVNAVLGLGPVKLPEYLDQPKIVSRLSANRLFLDDSHRWVEPLADNFTSVLKEELIELLHPRQIVTFPWPLSQEVDCQLVIQVLRFETTSDGTARLVANWMIRNRDGKLLQPEKQVSYLAKSTSTDYAARVRALNEVLDQFGHELADELLPLLQKTAADGEIIGK